MLYYQNDERWKNTKLGNTEMTIGSHGCLLTALTNIYNQEYRQDKTPDILQKELMALSGMTKEGLIIWDVAKKILKCDRIDHNYKGVIDYDMYNYFIVNYLNYGYGHFTNLIEKSNNDFFVYDVYDGRNKIKRINEIRRVVKIYF